MCEFTFVYGIWIFVAFWQLDFKASDSVSFFEISLDLNISELGKGICKLFLLIDFFSPSNLDFSGLILEENFSFISLLIKSLLLFSIS